MNKISLVLLSILINGLYCFAQSNYYTILRVNESKFEKIEVGTNKVLKGRGDTIPEEDSRIHWTSDGQSIEVNYSKDGKVYTLYSSDYFNCKDQWRERFSYIKYNTTASRGNEIGPLLCFLKSHYLLVERIPFVLNENIDCVLNIGNGRTYVHGTFDTGSRSIIFELPIDITLLDTQEALEINIKDKISGNQYCYPLTPFYLQE